MSAICLELKLFKPATLERSPDEVNVAFLIPQVILSGMTLTPKGPVQLSKLAITRNHEDL
ncbi:hypothetical protein Tdes44962_MAKER02049 [Teratosphaeria destructans]|uniref:Uncharacterized protein n=1 Tax=Teratosphaeria destructans TaxID=418781 RepID=A0A9W7W3S7_9PEZI|nr:hypothetical protein Tdes44962_MAKER02049 [Teratosphaeria destructans]